MQNSQWKSNKVKCKKKKNNNDILKNFSSPEKMSRQVWSLFIQAFYGFAVTNLKLYRLNLSSQEYSISFIIFYFTVRNNVCPTVTCPSNCQYGYDRTPAQNGCPQCKCGKYNLQTSYNISISTYLCLNDSSSLLLRIFNSIDTSITDLNKTQKLRDQWCM